jgi:hypothetical protein
MNKNGPVWGRFYRKPVYAPREERLPRAEGVGIVETTVAGVVCVSTRQPEWQGGSYAHHTMALNAAKPIQLNTVHKFSREAPFISSYSL